MAEIHTDRKPRPRDRDRGGEEERRRGGEEERMRGGEAEKSWSKERCCAVEGNDCSSSYCYDRTASSDYLYRGLGF